MAEYDAVQRPMRTNHVALVALGYRDLIEIEWDEYREGAVPTLRELDGRRTAHEVMSGRDR